MGLAEETSKTAGDAKQWKARGGQLDREFAIAKDHEKSVHQQSGNVKVHGFRSNEEATSIGAKTGFLSDGPTAGQPNKPSSPTGQVHRLSSSASHPASTSAASAGQSGYRARGSAGGSRGGDTSCQQQ